MTPDTLEEIAAEIRACTVCALARTRTQAVPGEAPSGATVVFVGEAPGAREDAAGRPFLGSSGRLLDALLEGVGMRRAEVAILNVLKCRPPENRDPRPAEVAACMPFLRRQLDALRPRVVATLGRHALAVFAPEAQLAAVHGTAMATERTSIAGGAMLVPLYHPAAALHNGTLRPTLERDMAALASVARAEHRPTAVGSSLYETLAATHTGEGRVEREVP